MLPVATGTPGPPRQKRHRMAWACAIVVALVAVGGLVLGAVTLFRGDGHEIVQVRSDAGLRPLPEGLRTEPRNAWTFRPGTSEVRWTTLDPAGDVYAVLASSSGLEVVHLDRATGEVQWRAAIDATEAAGVEATQQQVVVAIGGDDPRLVALDPASGAVRWEHRSDGAVMDQFVASDLGFVAVLVPAESGDGRLTVLDPDGKEVWSAPASAARVDGDLVLVQRAASVALLELATGAARWERPIDAGAQVTLDRDHAFVAERRSLTAFGPAGERLWQTTISADDPVDAVTQGDGLVVVLRASGLVALAERSGAVLWEAPPGGVVPDTNRDALTIRTSDDDLMLRVIGVDGRSRATRLVGPAAAVRVAQGVVYVDDGVGVTAYDRVSLAQLWTTVLDDNGGVVLVAAADRGVLVRDGSGNLLMLR